MKHFDKLLEYIDKNMMLEDTRNYDHTSIKRQFINFGAALLHIIKLPLLILLHIAVAIIRKESSSLKKLLVFPLDIIHFALSMIYCPLLIIKLSLEKSILYTWSLIEKFYLNIKPKTKIWAALLCCTGLLLAITLTGYFGFISINMPAAIIATAGMSILLLHSFFSRRCHERGNDMQLSIKDKFLYLSLTVIAPIVAFILEITGIYYFTLTVLILTTITPSFVMIPIAATKIAKAKTENESNSFLKFIEQNYKFSSTKSPNILDDERNFDLL